MLTMNLHFVPCINFLAQLKFPLFIKVHFALDVLWSVLRGGEPVQAPSHLHREDYRHLQGQEEARGAAPRLCHHRHCLQVCILVVLESSFV